MKSLLLIAMVVLLFSGCSLFKTTPLSFNVETEKGVPIVYIYPLTGVVQQDVVVGALPFASAANLNREDSLGISALFKDVFLGKQVFTTIKQLFTPYSDLEDAVALGREAKVDFVLAGRINYVVEGTELGGSMVDVSLRLLDVYTGHTVWYIEQTMKQQMDQPTVDMVSRLRQSFSPPPIRSSTVLPAIPNMLLKIAVDMAHVMTSTKRVSK